MATRQETCEERIDAQLASRIVDISLLVRAANGDVEPTSDQLESLGVTVDGYDDDATAESAREVLDEYPLSIDTRTVCRVQLSTGGPGDEFEFEVEDGRIESSITYRFLDWFDGATRTVNDEDVEAWLDGIAELTRYADA